MASEPVVPQDQSENKRERSTIEFPYLDQDDSVEIAQAILTGFGTSCLREQLAAQLQQTATGGGFNLRLATAKMYGLINYERGTITLTDLGMRIADPQQEKAARVESFLMIPLYRALYDKYSGKALPSTSVGLEAEMGSMGVAPKQKDRARQVFQRSAKEAGFFWSGNDRLVLPATGKPIGSGEKNREEPPPLDPNRNAPPPPPVPQYPAFVQGLLLQLPKKQGDLWSAAEKETWLKAAALIFDMIYPDTNTKGTWKIEFQVENKV